VLFCNISLTGWHPSYIPPHKGKNYYSILHYFRRKSTTSHHQFKGYEFKIAKNQIYELFNITKLKTDLKFMPVKLIIHHAGVSVERKIKINDCY